jgi:hypothetical protein
VIERLDMKRICFAVMPFGLQSEYTGAREEADFVFLDIVKPAVECAVREFKTQYGDRLGTNLKSLGRLRT